MSLSMTMAGYGVSVCLSVEVAGAGHAPSSEAQALLRPALPAEDLLPVLAAAMPAVLLEAHQKLSAAALQELTRLRSAEVESANRALTQEGAQ